MFENLLHHSFILYNKIFIIIFQLLQFNKRFYISSIPSTIIFLVTTEYLKVKAWS